VGASFRFRFWSEYSVAFLNAARTSSCSRAFSRTLIPSTSSSSQGLDTRLQFQLVCIPAYTNPANSTTNLDSRLSLLNPTSAGVCGTFHSRCAVDRLLQLVYFHGNFLCFDVHVRDLFEEIVRLCPYLAFFVCCHPWATATCPVSC
jgi:hypothetical protein